VQDHTQQLALMRTLDALLNNEPQVGRCCLMPHGCVHRCMQHLLHATTPCMQQPHAFMMHGCSAAPPCRQHTPCNEQLSSACHLSPSPPPALSPPHQPGPNLQVVLIIIDSVTFHFRQDWPDAGLRSRLLAGMAQDAIALAEARGLAMVFMNQVTTKVMDEGAGGSVLVPALGESWGQASGTRVVLFWEGPQRYAHLLKASHVPEGLVGAGGQQQQGRGGRGRQQQAAVAFDVTQDGVRSAALAAVGGGFGGGGGRGQQPVQRQQQQQQQQQYYQQHPPQGLG